MYRLIIFFTLLTLLSNGQSKKPVIKAPVKVSEPKDTLAAVTDTLDKKETLIRAERKFAVYSKKARSKKETRLKLCIQLVEDTVLTYCVNDSLCRDPEVTKILFQQRDGDTNYVLVFVDAFSKPADKPSCDAGKETKFFFARWNTNTNKAIWKQRTVSSCMKGITNMTREPIVDWDKSSPLTVKFHRGGISFVEIKFDPLQYKSGIQTVSDTGRDADGTHE